MKPQPPRTSYVEDITTPTAFLKSGGKSGPTATCIRNKVDQNGLATNGISKGVISSCWTILPLHRFLRGGRESKVLPRWESSLCYSSLVRWSCCASWFVGTCLQWTIIVTATPNSEGHSLIFGGTVKRLLPVA